MAEFLAETLDQERNVGGLSTMRRTGLKLTLDRPAAYEIQVPGELDESWSDWDGKMTVKVVQEGDGLPVTTLSGIVADQAALHGLLRQLYAVGLPLISVICVDCGPE